MWMNSLKLKMPTRQEALPGRAERMAVPAKHFVLGTPLEPPFPSGMELALFGMGCFWGAERMFWKLKGVYSTSVGYAGGYTPNPTYREVCSGLTGHTEVVRVVFDPQEGQLRRRCSRSSGRTTTRRRACVRATTRARSTARRSTRPTPAQAHAAEISRGAYQAMLAEAGYGDITTEIAPAPELYYAEDYHQQYLAKNPDGYCGIGGTGVSCPIGASNPQLEPEA